jgi:hypothetical protein
MEWIGAEDQNRFDPACPPRQGKQRIPPHPHLVEELIALTDELRIAITAGRELENCSTSRKGGISRITNGLYMRAQEGQLQSSAKRVLRA